MATDMFLEIVTKKGGKLKGESMSASCPDQIEVVKFEVSVNSPSDADGQATGRVSYEHATFDFPTSIASTPLFQTLCTNDLIKTATLTVRKGGAGTGKEATYLQWRFNDARLVSFKMTGEKEETNDSISLAYSGVEISYKRQKADGTQAAPQSASYSAGTNTMVKSTLS